MTIIEIIQMYFWSGLVGLVMIAAPIALLVYLFKFCHDVVLPLLKAWKFFLGLGLIIFGFIVSFVFPFIGHLLYISILFVGICWVISLITHSREFQAVEHRINRWMDEELGNEEN